MLFCFKDLRMKMKLPLWLLLLELILAERVVSSDEPIAETPLGRLRGHVMTSRAGREFLAFSGVPYAKPPIGELRFEPPVPIEPWADTKDALEDGPYCTQATRSGLMGVEDCLYLSVFTHNLTDKRPVYVHIHGGGFVTGTGARKTGPQYLMDEELVVVDVNYRLSMFGFLSFEDKDMPGNQGLKDQSLALRWVQANIASFGGDPSKVTIVGESAGGASVYHHTVSPLSNGLFHGVIAESGSSYNHWAVREPGAARDMSMQLVTLMGCKYTTTQEAVACLRTKDDKELAKQISALKKNTPGPVLEPTHPGAFLVGPISEWQHASVPMMIGTTSAEGLMMTLFMNHTAEYYKWLYDNFEEVGFKRLDIYGLSPENKKKVSQEILQFYFPNGEITEKEFVNLTTMMSDREFTTGIIDSANNHEGGNVYFYYFDYVGKYSIADEGGVPLNRSMIFGSFHVDEIIYLYYNKLFENLEGQDLDFSKKLVKLWTNFVINGETNMGEWEKWNRDKDSYFHINNEGFKMKENFARSRYQFWKDLEAKYNIKKWSKE